MHHPLCLARPIFCVPDLALFLSTTLNSQPISTRMARVALTLALAVGVHSTAVELTPDNFDKEVLQSGKAAFIKFLAPW